MKRDSTQWVLLLPWLAFAITCRAAIIVYEPFDYSPPGADVLNANGGLGFASGWRPGGFNASIHTNYDVGIGSLSFANLQTSGRHARTGPVPAISGLARTLSAALGASGTTNYVSFLLRPEGTLGAGAFNGFFGLYLTSSLGTDLFIGKPGGGNIDHYVLETRGGSVQASSDLIARVGETVLLVVKAEFRVGFDRFTLYVNPVPGAPEPASTTVKSDLDVGAVAALTIYGTGSFALDEIRIGQNFSDVVPHVQTQLPLIVGQPRDQTVRTGEPAIFNVTATGQGPFAYQWVFAGSNSIAGATNSSFGLPNVQPTHVGDYSVVVANAFGSVTSTPARLSIVIPSLISSDAREDFWVPDNVVVSIAVTNGIVYAAGAFTAIAPNFPKGDLLNLVSGLPRPDFPKIDGVVATAVPDDAGGFYIGGEFSSVGGETRANVAHIMADNTVDPSWNPGANATVVAIAVVGGTVYVGGLFTIVGSEARNNIAALDARSGQVKPWNPEVCCTVDPQVLTRVLAIKVLGSTVYFGGQFTHVGGQPRNSIAAVHAVTGLPTSWNPNALSSGGSPLVYTLHVAEKVIYAGGRFSFIGGQSRNNLAALDMGSGMATPWNPNANKFVASVTEFCNTVYVGGSFTTIGGQTRSNIAALNPTNGLATAWNPDANGDVIDMEVLGNTLYAGGTFTRIGGQQRRQLAALDLLSGLATPWNPRSDEVIQALAVSGSHIFVAGSQSGGSLSRSNLAAFDARTGSPMPWYPRPNNAVYALAASSNTVYIAGPFTAVSNQARINLAAVDAVTGQVKPWRADLSAGGYVNAMVVSGDTVYVGGYFPRIGTANRNNLAALDATTGNVRVNWNPNPNNEVVSLAVHGNTLYISGVFNSVGGEFRNFFAALDVTTGVAASWNPAPTGDFGYGLAAAADRIFAGGYFTEIGGQPLRLLAALDPVTAMALPWVPNPVALAAHAGGYVSGIATINGQVFVTGDFFSIAGQPRNNLGAVTRDTAVATDWNPGPSTSSSGLPVYSMVTSTNALYIGGNFTSLRDKRRAHFAAFELDGSPVVIRQPRIEPILEGQNAILSVDARGNGALAYQWQFNGTNIAGATNATLVITAAQLTDSGSYTVVVRNDIGLVNSAPAVLTVVRPVTILVQPQSQIVAPGANVTLAVVADGHPPPLYQWRLNGVNIPGAVFSSLTLTNVQPTNGGSYNVVIDNGQGAVSSDVAHVLVTSPVLPFTDNFGDRVEVNTAAGVGRGSNSLSTAEPGESQHAGKAGGRSIWLAWRAPASGIAIFHTRGSGFDTLLGVYTNTIVSQTNLVAADEDRGEFLTSRVVFNAIAGVEYQIAIDGFAGAFGNIVLSWSIEVTTNQLPRILTHPRSQIVARGSDYTLDVHAVGIPPLFYQWFHNCLPIPNATNSSFAVTNIQSASVGLYFVRVTGAGRTVESAPAFLEIGPQADIFSQDKLEDIIAAVYGPPPFAASAAAFALGSGGIINVAMGSVTPPQLFDNTGSSTSANESNHCAVLGGASKWFAVHPLESATLVVDTIGSSIDTVLAVYRGPDALQLAVVTCDDNGAPDRIRSLARFDATNTTNYWVVVDGVQGAVGNIQLNWKLGRGPTIISAPRPATPRLGQTFVLEITATNAIPNPTYQWFHNGIAMIGATNATLSISNVQASAAGTYSVVVENYAGSTNHSFGAFDVALPIPVKAAIVLNSGTNYLQLTTDEPAKRYVIEAGTDFLQWVPLHTNTSDTTAPINFLNPQTNVWRYYRVVPLP